MNRSPLIFVLASLNHWAFKRLLKIPIELIGRVETPCLLVLIMENLCWLS